MRRRRTYKLKRGHRKIRKGGNNNSKKNTNITMRPTVKHPNDLPPFGPPGIVTTQKRRKFLKPSSYLPTSDYSFFSANKNKNLGFK